jgi:hypothetical protein
MQTMDRESATDYEAKPALIVHMADAPEENLYFVKVRKPLGSIHRADSSAQ